MEAGRRGSRDGGRQRCRPPGRCRATATDTGPGKGTMGCIRRVCRCRGHTRRRGLLPHARPCHLTGSPKRTLPAGHSASGQWPVASGLQRWPSILQPAGHRSPVPRVQMPRAPPPPLPHGAGVSRPDRLPYPKHKDGDAAGVALGEGADGQQPSPVELVCRARGGACTRAREAEVGE